MRIARRVHSSPWWARVLLVYVASRVVSTTLLLTAFLTAKANDLTFASPRSTFFDFLGSWDASSYRRIATDGYPSELPLDAAGNVQSNVWAFLPAFPWLTRAVGSVTMLEFYAAGVLVATVFGALAALALYRLLSSRVGGTSAMWAVILFCCGPMAFLLQTAYAESMFLFLVFACLIAIEGRRYLLVIPFGVVAAFTRPGILAVALALVIVFVIRLVRREVYPLAEKIRMVIAGLAVAAAGLAWPVIAGIATGTPDAYVQTEMSWWVAFVGRVHLVPLTPWFLMATTWLGPIGIIAVLAIVGVFVWWISRRRMRTLGPVTLAFGASYALYLFAVFLPQESTLRLLLPLSPLLGDPAIARSAALRRSLLAAGIVFQAVAIVLLWFLAYP